MKSALKHLVEWHHVRTLTVALDPSIALHETQSSPKSEKKLSHDAALIWFETSNG